MKLIDTKDAAGHILCHDLTQIIPNEYKGARFRKGQVITEEDIPVLLSMGKEHLYVWEMREGILHENDAAERLCGILMNENMTRTEAREGKIELHAAADGVFLVDSGRLLAVNSIGEITVVVLESELMSAALGEDFSRLLMLLGDVLEEREGFSVYI